MRDINIITLYKNKCDRSDCNNYRGTLNRLQKLADRVYPESLRGFRAVRFTTDMIFSVRQLQEQCREQRQPLCIAFIDLPKAFYLVSRHGLFKVLDEIGCPSKLLSMTRRSTLT
jgi:hypothetical protein